MTRRLVLAMSLLVAVVAIALAVPLVIVVGTDQRTAFVSNLEVDTLSAASLLSSEPSSQWDATADLIAAQSGARVVVVDVDRNLIADSDDSGLDRSFDRPEINAALDGELSSDVRSSVTLGEDLRFVAAPVVQDLGIVAAVRLSLPESIVDDEVRETAQWLIVFVFCVVIAAGLVAWLLARSISSPLNRLANVAQELPEDLRLRADENSGPGEVRSVAKALNGTALRLSGILRRTQRVAADASHHLRTPLTGVRLRLEAIEDISTDVVVRDEARAATAEVDRLARRIEQVLALARTDAGQEPTDIQDISLVLADRVDAASGMFDERGIGLTSDLEPGLVVRAASGVVARVIDELLGNALDYARTRVVVSARRSGGSVVLSVADDGPGIPVAEREAVFERFTRGSESVLGGSGLGLALVSESIGGLGGTTIAVSAGSIDAAFGTGLCIVITMPVAQS
ncbi:MAG: ATP-binding protein [bacterium]|nr:ATP-binding protein [bacterium]